MQMEKDNGSCRKKKELIRLKTDWKKKAEPNCRIPRGKTRFREMSFKESARRKD